jgi:septal ring factor EnvC (AmiA/AmiB activator)
MKMCRYQHSSMRNWVLGIFGLIGVACSTGTVVYFRVADRAQLAADMAAKAATVENEHWEAHGRQYASVRRDVDEMTRSQREIDKTIAATNEFRVSVKEDLAGVRSDVKDLSKQTVVMTRAIDRIVTLHEKELPKASTGSGE